jgi:glycosyltransferase involved in cell wall biosynthesis
VPIYSSDCRGSLVKRSFERSPAIALETNATSIDEIPCSVRSAADTTILDGALSGYLLHQVPQHLDGVLTWLAGETLLTGAPAAIRHDLQVPGRCVFVPVHVPGVDEIPFVTLQPRWFRAGRRHNYWNFNVRLQSSSVATPRLLQALRTKAQPWAQLSCAVLAEHASPGAGAELLVRLQESSNQLPRIFAALVLRNLVVLMLRHNEHDKAEQLLAAGMQTYPGYAELPYLAALLAWRNKRTSQTLALAEKTKKREASFLGSGGESSYRADWLLGCLAASVGNERVAFAHFLSGLNSDPVFPPAVDELLKLRLPPNLVEAHQFEFCRVARNEPQLLEKIFHYLLLHRVFDPARRIIQTNSLSADRKATLQERLSCASASFSPTFLARIGKPGVVICGSFLEHTSLARINRELAAALVDSPNLDLCLEPSSPSSLLPRMVTRGEKLVSSILRRPTHLDLTIRHQWPPDFTPSPRGKLAVIIPWEYGAVPRVWLEQIENNVDELWVPSKFVHDVFRRAGVSTSVEVIPNGIDAHLFHSEGPPLRPQGSRSFVFLFVGGAIRRKGIDLLLQAYQAAFDPGEDVSLVLNVSGSAASYQHNSLLQQLQGAANNPTSPHVQPLLDSLDDAALASLYRGSNAFVLPYRGEGFGMPLLEAMACGKPVITTALGPSRDFCSKETAYLVAAREEEVPDEPPPLGPLVGNFTWFEPDFAELVRTLRHVYENRNEAARRGRAAANFVHRSYTWPQITRRYADRMFELINGDANISCAEDQGNMRSSGSRP